jgi:hypothetical protein
MLPIIVLATMLCVILIVGGRSTPIDNTIPLCGCSYKSKTIYVRPKENKALVPVTRHYKVLCSKHKKQTEGCGCDNANETTQNKDTTKYMDQCKG